MPQLDAALLDHAFALVGQGVEDGTFPSAVLAIADRYTILRQEAFDSMERAERERSTDTAPRRAGVDSLYEIMSITKPIFATAIMRLVERGHILLHEPVANVWPEFAANDKQAVTLWHLLTHTSGLDEQDFWTRARANPRFAFEPHAAELAAVAECGLRHPPGTRYVYCNPSFRAMAGLLERLTGRSYVEYLQAEVLDPLGMRDTTFRPSPEQRQRLVPTLEPPYGAHHEHFLQSAWPYGGLYSTAADLIAFGRAFLEGGRGPGVGGQGSYGSAPSAPTPRPLTPGPHSGYRLLGTVAHAEMTRLQFEGSEEPVPSLVLPVRSGLAWSLNKGLELAPATAYGHGGGTGGYLLVDPVHDLITVFLTNRWNQPVAPRDRVFNAVYGAINHQ